jgi:hypothetical protein
MSLTIDFVPDGLNLERYLASAADVAAIIGPWGSGKSRASVIKLLLNVLAQKPAKDGRRHRRTLVTRSTYAELEDTTLKTWLAVFPEDKFGPLRRSRPFRHHIRVGDWDWEVLFLALEGEEDRKKLLSLDLSDAFVNEARETHRGIIDDITGRLGRYPSVADGGCARPQLIMDSNAPDVLHWLAVVAGMVPMPPNLSEAERRRLTRPGNWDIFTQPPGLVETKDREGNILGYEPNPEAENVRWLRPGYYQSIIVGKEASWIDVNVMNRPGQLRSGKAVYPMFVERVHVAREPLAFLDGHRLWIGVDFGRTPAAVFGQRVFDRWRILAELCAEDMGARAFARLVRKFLAERFPGASYAMFGDPAGTAKSQADDSTPFGMFRAEGFKIQPASTNDPDVRRGAVEEALRGLDEGHPRFLLDGEACPILRAGFQGGYAYRKMAVSGSDMYSDEPEKNRYSHPHDGLQYMMVGAGEGRAVMGKTASAGLAPKVARGPRGSVFQRRHAS